MLSLINGSTAQVGARLEPTPNEQGTGNVVATSVDGQMHLPAKLSRMLLI